MGGQILLARLLGPSSFGLYSIGWTILRIVGIVGPLGLEQGVLRFSPTYDREHPESFRSIFYQTFSTAFISGFMIGIVIFFAAPWLAVTLFNKPELGIVIRVFTFAFPLLCGLRVAASATRISQKMQYAIYSEEISQPAVNLLLVFFLSVFGLTLNGAVIAGVLSFTISFLISLYYVVRLFRESFAAAGRLLLANKELLAYSIPTALSIIFSSAILLFDRLFIGIFRPENEAGVYQAISLFPLIFVTILSAIKTIFAPMVVRLHIENQKNRFNHLFILSTKWGLYLSIPIMLVILVFPVDTINALFGTAYVSGYLALSILIFGQFINIGTGPVDIILMMTGHQKDWLFITGGVFGINIILDILLIPTYGLLGAALSVSLAISAIYLIALIRVKRLFSIFPYNLQYLKGVIATAFTMFLLLLASRIALELHLRLMVFIIISVIGFFMSLYFLGLYEDDREMIYQFSKYLTTNKLPNNPPHDDY